MSKYIYISSFLPRTQKKQLALEMRNFNFNSADAFSYSIFCGLSSILGTGMECLNIAPLGAYPRFNSKHKYSGGFEVDNGVKVNSVGYSTFYVYQYFSIYKNLFKNLRKLNYQEPITFIIYSINIPVLMATIRYRNKMSPESKIILIVPDLLEYSLEESLASKIKTAIIGDMRKFYEEVDGFVFLTEAMNERVRTRHPYCIVEGIYNQEEHRTVDKSNDGLKRIFYSGMLYEKFGVKTLVDAFMMTSDKDYRLQLCGVGDLEEYIKKAARKDSRIEYLGLLSRERALQMQSEATLLVNPRTPEGEFTKYSFPSKNIEYLASGTPVLLYELPGIPTEYYEYCYCLTAEETDVVSLYNKIEEVIHLPDEELRLKAAEAAQFVRTMKNARKQTEKIVELAESL